MNIIRSLFENEFTVGVVPGLSVRLNDVADKYVNKLAPCDHRSNVFGVVFSADLFKHFDHTQCKQIPMGRLNFPLFFYMYTHTHTHIYTSCPESVSENCHNFNCGKNNLFRRGR